MKMLFQNLAPKWAADFVLAILLIGALQPGAMAQEKNHAFGSMSREPEIELALSAAPEHLRKDATVYVLEKGYYVKAQEGSNGFSCLVVRFGAIIAPYCYDAEGSQTTMLADFRRAELMEQGKTLREAEQILAEEYKAGKLIAPRKPGVAYMLSPEFKKHDHQTGEAAQVFPPHVMFYAPYAKNSEIGALPEHFNSASHIFVLNEGRPDAYFIIVPKQN
jgi:hypothetical protein